jgi:AcrR family transcriptional regulator
MAVNAVNSPSSTGPTDRRQRQRDATMTEIRDVARRQLAVTGAAALSLRAVAREMGLTAPALYRYYDDRDALLTALIVDGYTSLCQELEAARDAASTPGARITAMSLAYRRWAVAHPHEFALVFGAPVPGYAAPEDGPTHEAGLRFGSVFLEVFAEVHATTDFALRPAEHRTPELETALSAWKDGPAPLPAGAMQVFLACWSRLHGMISLEVFGHLHWVGLPEPEDLFRAHVATMMVELGLPAAPALQVRPPQPASRG